MSAQPKLHYTLEEYLELDRISDERLEFWDGEIFSMSGVSDQHSQIEVNVIVSLDARLSGRGCRHYKSIRSFSEYLLISQDRPNVSQFIKQGDGFWLYREFDFLGEVIKLASFDCELPLKEIYRNVKFDADKIK